MDTCFYAPKEQPSAFASRRILTALALAFFLSLSAASAFDEIPIKGDLVWPDHWTVFAPFDDAEHVAGPDQLRTVPERLRTVNTAEAGADVRETQGVHIETQPGKPVDLFDFFGRQAPRNVAYVFLELESSCAQEVTLGMGADWWMEVWLNGEALFDTLESSGNVEFPISMTNHRIKAPLDEGTNVLAVRFITGSAGSLLALGGPGEFATAEERLTRQRKQSLNVFPEEFEDRLIFPVETQATVMAETKLILPETDADLKAGELAGLEPMPRRQMDGRRDTLNRGFDDPVAVKLSKYRYPWEDAHLDAIAWTTPEEEGGSTPQGRLKVLLKDETGRMLSRNVIEELSPSGWFFSVGFPETLRGAEGSLEVIWMDGRREVGRIEAPFHVEPPSGVERTGRVPLRILNSPGAHVKNAPMTLGVPFPRGALWNPEHLRLVDETGVEQPLQVRESGRWSRFGSVKWLLCDFTVDLTGEPREWYLEFGPSIRPAELPPIEVHQNGGFPSFDAGRLQVTDGTLYYDMTGEGDFEPVLTGSALTGAFVRHESGKLFEAADDLEHAVEEIGPQKILVRRTGWYEEPASGERFCQFVTRFMFHRNSPVVRVYHTWIYTGNSNVDRIADMGWLFETAAPITEGEFLNSFNGGEWIDSSSLVQFDYQHYLLPERMEEHPGRTPGVASMVIGNARLTFGAKDYWQNFPNELAFEDEGLAFYNWPKRNPEARFERPVPVDEAFRLRFAHEGEVLDFRMPDEYADHDIWFSATRGHPAGMHYLEGRPETANAQGIARTEEMFLLISSADSTADNASRVIEGLNDETLRAVVDPHWVTGTGVFGTIHPKDTERFPEEERLYALTAQAPARLVERMGTYGKWLYGDYPTWNVNLPRRWVDNYRAYQHMAYSTHPYHIIPFARTGEPQFLKLAENGARQLADASFCHYASADVDESVGPEFYRRQGWLGSMSMMPWAVGSGPRNRGITVDSDFLWNIYYLTGYGRVRDVALLFGELTKQDSMSIPITRYSQSSLKSYLDMYQATFDPWFLDAANELANLHLRAFGGGHEIDALTSTPARDITGYDHWRAADQAFYAFTGSDEYRSIAVNSAISQANPRKVVIGAGAGRDGGAGRHSAYAWFLTRDPFYLRRTAAAIDYLRYATYEGEVEYFLGTPPGSKGNATLAMARTVPMAMAALVDAGVVEEMPDPIHNAVWIPPERPAMRFPSIYVNHDGDGPLVLSLDARGGGVTRSAIHYRITGPQGVIVDREGITSDENIELNAPAGVYEVRVTGNILLFLPLTHPDVPEVTRFEPGEDGIAVDAGALGYWFLVPEGVREFRITYNTPAHGRRFVHRASVWGPDGQRLWDRSFQDNDLPVEAVIKVPEGWDGKLWRATGGSFIIDPQIPPFFSLSKSQWFNPLDH